MNQTRTLAPISVSTYNRLEHLKKTIESLQKNTLAKETVLYVFSDAAKKGDEEMVNKVRAYLKTIDGFKEVRIVEQKTNDIKKNMKDAREIPLGEFGKMIRMEDDNVTSPYFLQYMNDGLDFYKDDEEIIAICGYNLPLKYSNCVKSVYKSIFFNTCGFGIWANRNYTQLPSYKDGYNEIMSDKQLYRKFKRIHPNLISHLKRIQEGKLDAGDYSITFYMIKNDKYVIKPIKSFVNNIGFDGSGMHCGKSNRYENNSLNNSIIKFPDKLEYDYKFDKLWLKYSYKQNIIIKVLSLIKRTIKYLVKTIKN